MLLHLHLAAGPKVWINLDNIVQCYESGTGGTQVHCVNGAIFHIQETMDQILAQIPERE